jgi:hypothetical protein
LAADTHARHAECLGRVGAVEVRSAGASSIWHARIRYCHICNLHVGRTVHRHGHDDIGWCYRHIANARPVHVRPTIDEFVAAGVCGAIADAGVLGQVAAHALGGADLGLAVVVGVAGDRLRFGGKAGGEKKAEGENFAHG